MSRCSQTAVCCYPNELNNIYGKPGTQKIEKELKKLLANYRKDLKAGSAAWRAPASSCTATTPAMTLSEHLYVVQNDQQNEEQNFTNDL